MAPQAVWWGPICIVDVLIIVAGRRVDLVAGEGAVYNGRLTTSHTPPYIYLPSFDPYRAPPVTWPPGSNIHVVMSGGRHCSQTEHEVCLRVLSISPGQLNCAGEDWPPSPPPPPPAGEIDNSQTWRPGRWRWRADRLGRRELKTHQTEIFLVASFT